MRRAATREVADGGTRAARRGGRGYLAGRQIKSYGALAGGGGLAFADNAGFKRLVFEVGRIFAAKGVKR